MREREGVSFFSVCVPFSSSAALCQRVHPRRRKPDHVWCSDRPARRMRRPLQKKCPRKRKERKRKKKPALLTRLTPLLLFLPLSLLPPADGAVCAGHLRGEVRSDHRGLVPQAGAQPQPPRTTQQHEQRERAVGGMKDTRKSFRFPPSFGPPARPSPFFFPPRLRLLLPASGCAFARRPRGWRRRRGAPRRGAGEAHKVLKFQPCVCVCSKSKPPPRLPRRVSPRLLEGARRRRAASALPFLSASLRWAVSLTALVAAWVWWPEFLCATRPRGPFPLRWRWCAGGRASSSRPCVPPASTQRQARPLRLCAFAIFIPPVTGPYFFIFSSRHPLLCSWPTRACPRPTLASTPAPFSLPPGRG